MALDFRSKYGVLLCFSAIVLGSYCVDALNTIYMDNVCGKDDSTNVKLNVMTSGILKSDRKNSWNKDVDCTVTFVPHPGDMVVLSLYKYTLASGDELMITDHDNHKVLLHESGNFQDERKSFTSEGLMTVRYKTNSSVESVPGGGFQLTFTQAKELPCLPNYYQCENKRCIEKHLACDGHNHCGDNSDQMNCVPKQPHTELQVDNHTNISRQNVAVTLSISVSLLVTVSLFIILIVYAVQRRKERNSIKANAAAHPLPNTSRVTASASGREVPVISESMQKADVVVSVADGEHHPVTHQVPPLYPHLSPGVEQPPTAPDFEDGIGNPAYSSKE